MNKHLRLLGLLGAGMEVRCSLSFSLNHGYVLKGRYCEPYVVWSLKLRDILCFISVYVVIKAKEADASLRNCMRAIVLIP